MLPLIMAAFAGLGVTRLTLLALQLSIDQNARSSGDGGSGTDAYLGGDNADENGAEEARFQQHRQLTPRSSQEEEERALEEVVAAMARLEKPVKMLQRGEIHYICIWREEDFHPHMSEADLVRAAVQRQERDREARGKDAAESRRSGFQQELFRTLQDMTAFFDQLVVGKTLEPLLCGESDGSEVEAGPRGRGHTRRHATGGGWLQLHEQEEEKEEEGSEAEEEEKGFWSWWGGSKPAVSARERGECEFGSPGSAHSPHFHSAGSSSSSSMCSTRDAAAGRGGGEGGEGGEERNLCLVCYEREQDAVLLTCGHGGTCFRCACDVYRRSGECPLCRARVEQIVRIGRRRQCLPNALAVVPVMGPWPASCW